MTDEKKPEQVVEIIDKSRRGVMQKAATGAGAAAVAGVTLPKKWTKPVMDSVILPAHAETTSGAGGAGGTTTTTTTPAPTTTGTGDG